MPRAGSIYWEDAGDSGQPGLVLVHSLGCDSRMWNDQLGVLTGLQRVVWTDLPGHGHSTAVQGEYTLDDLGNDVMAVASATGFDQFDICGISLGVLISMWAAVNHPDRIRRLIA